MKRIAGVLLVMVILLSGFAWAEETEEIQGGILNAEEEFVMFEPVLTEVVDASSSEWMASSKNRALLTVTLMLDLQVYLDELKENSLGELEEDPIGEFEIFASTYVGESDVNLMVYIPADKADIIIAYCPALGEAGYMLIDIEYEELFAEVVMNELCDSGYYENDLEDILDMFTELGEIFE